MGGIIEGGFAWDQLVPRLTALGLYSPDVDRALSVCQREMLEVERKARQRGADEEELTDG
jgi:hypothetical protein